MKNFEANMEFFDIFSSDLIYICAVKILKFFGFAFYSIKQTSSGLKFCLRVSDHIFFIVSITFSVFIFRISQNADNLRTKSPIINTSLKFLFNMVMLNALCSKIIHRIGDKKSFESVLGLSVIAKKVCIRLYYP